MPKVVLFNSICIDGDGDFYHFLDISLYLMSLSSTKVYEFVAFIEAMPEKHAKIRAMLPKKSFLQIFIVGHKEFIPNKKLQKHFKEAEQLIYISYYSTRAYEKLLSPSAVIKFIAEHERFPRNSKGNEILGCSLGLSKGSFGIKLKNLLRMPTIEALTLMQANKEDFFSQLHQHSTINDSQAFIANFSVENELIPAYFNNFGNFFYFILEALNFFYSNNISIYASGSDLGKAIADESKTVKPGFWNSPFSYGFYQNISKMTPCGDVPINRIEIIEPKKSPMIYLINSSCTRVMRIYYGFSLSDTAYEALYAQAHLAGISGDNTFEKAVSNNVFPVYHSTNSYIKHPTLCQLSCFIYKLSIPDEVKENFIIYFKLLPSYFRKELNTEERKLFFSVDRNAMLTYWPRVSLYLKNHHNFYHHLESLFFEKIRSAPKPQTNIRSKLGFFKELKEGYNLCLKGIGVMPWVTSLGREIVTRLQIRMR